MQLAGAIGRDSAVEVLPGVGARVREMSQRGRKYWTSGPMARANTMVPMPKVPPRIQPRVRTVIDDGAGEPDRWSLAAIPVISLDRVGAGPRLAPIETGGDADQDDPAEHHRPGNTRHLGRRDDDAGQIDDDPDDDCVEQRAQPVGRATQPEEEHGHRDDDRRSPTVSPKRRASPWCKTSHGGTPIPDCSISPMPMPNRTRPINSCVMRRGRRSPATGIRYFKTSTPQRLGYPGREVGACRRHEADQHMVSPSSL